MQGKRELMSRFKKQQKDLDKRQQLQANALEQAKKDHEKWLFEKEKKQVTELKNKKRELEKLQQEMARKAEYEKRRIEKDFAAERKRLAKHDKEQKKALKRQEKELENSQRRFAEKQRKINEKNQQIEDAMRRKDLSLTMKGAEFINNNTEQKRITSHTRELAKQKISTRNDENNPVNLPTRREKESMQVTGPRGRQGMPIEIDRREPQRQSQTRRRSPVRESQKRPQTIRPSTRQIIMNGHPQLRQRQHQDQRRRNPKVSFDYH